MKNGFLKNLLFEPEEKVEEEKKIEPKIVSPTPTQTTVTSVSISDAGHVDNEILEVFENRVKELNIPGPDYYEMKEQVLDERMKAHYPDETERWKNVFFHLSYDNPELTKDKVISSISKYEKVVEDMRQSGKNQIEEKRKVKIGDKEQEISSIEQEIKDLEKQIEEKRAKSSSLLSEVESARQEYIQKELDLDKTANALLDSFKADKELLTKIL